MVPPVKRPLETEDDWETEVKSIQQMSKSIPTSMAKLFQQKPVFDPYTRFQEKWPKPVAAAAGEGQVTTSQEEVTPYAVVADVFADITVVGSRLSVPNCCPTCTGRFWNDVDRTYYRLSTLPSTNKVLRMRASS